MIIYLVRHVAYANPEGIFAFHLPLPITCAGRQYAGRIAGWFAEQRMPGARIYSSPIVRAVQTAEVIAARIDSHVEIDGRLIESCAPTLQGTKKPIAGCAEFEYRPEVREWIPSIAARMMASVWEKVVRDFDCILVSHGDPLTVLFHTIASGEAPARYWEAEGYVQMGEIVIMEASRAKGTLCIKERLRL